MKDWMLASDRSGLGLVAVVWVARLAGLASCIAMAVVAYDQRANPATMAVDDLVLFALFPTAVGLGLVLGWRWELAGGLVAVAGWAAYQAAHSFLVGTFCRDWEVNLLSAPGLLFVVAGALRARAKARATAASAAPVQQTPARSEASRPGPNP